MKKFGYLLISLVVLSSCSNLSEKKPLTKLFSEDFKKLQAENKITIIDLDSISNFSGLVKRMGELDCEGKVSGLRFQLNDTLYHLTGLSACPTSSQTACYFSKNLLYIRNDSLVGRFRKEEKQHIGNLKGELNKIMTKTYNFQHNENKVRPALIRFYVEDEYSMSTTKISLKEIIKQFSHINLKHSSNYFEYDILFESFDWTSIVIPPPPPKPNEIDN